MKQYKAVLISPDGQDKVTDFYKSNSIQEVWNKVNDMGSRWFFYPIIFVIPDNNTKVLNNRIASAPDTYPEIAELQGKSVKTAMNWITNNQDLINIILS